MYSTHANIFERKMSANEISSALYYPYVNGRWSGISEKPYKKEKTGFQSINAQPRFKGVVRAELATNQTKIKFHVRYFEISRGGYTTFERHQHAHVIIVKRGKGIAIAGNEIYCLKEDDLLIIKQGAPHQLINQGEEPFGIYCVVDAERDTPQPITRKELENLQKKNQKIAEIVKPEWLQQ